jgi:hypothetical protein
MSLVGNNSLSHATSSEVQPKGFSLLNQSLLYSTCNVTGTICHIPLNGLYCTSAKNLKIKYRQNKMLLLGVLKLSDIVSQLHFYEQLQWRTQEFYSGGVQQIHLRTEITGIWGQWSTSQGFWRQL